MSIPIIDTHQHLWDLSKVAYDWLVPEYGPLYRTYLAPELEPQLAEAGVTATILVQSANSYADTVYMLEIGQLQRQIGSTYLTYELSGQIPDARYVRFRVNPVNDDLTVLTEVIVETLAPSAINTSTWLLVLKFWVLTIMPPHTTRLLR